jgi:uncharacterized protein (DUF983 family)
MGLFRHETDTTDDGGDVIEESPAPDQAPRAAVHAGVPGRCPECGGFGYIDHIDMKYRTQTQHCRDCRHSWQFSFDEHGEVIDLTDG